MTGRIVASLLTDRDVDDASQVEPLLEQIDEPVELLMGDGGYDRTGVYTALDERCPDAVIVVPPRADAVLSATADTPSATATSRRSLEKGEWLGSTTAAIACVNEPWPTLLTNVGSPWLYWRLTPDAARPSQPARPLGAVQKAARRPCRGATLRS